MTPKEIEQEVQHRIQERLAILCEDREPTKSQLEIATKEALEWKRNYLLSINLPDK